MTAHYTDEPSTSTTLTVYSDDSPGPFEGPEKLLECWFAPSQDLVPSEIKGGRKGKAKWTGLRQVERQVWDDMLDEVQCKVLSVIEGEEVDAYLLSESSMFVWPHKIILKTCGTTTLLLGLPTLLRIASQTCSFRGVWRCFYSRKTFMFPDRQRGPHKDWHQETGFLDQIFENSSAYTVGRMNGDHWLLYLTPPRADVLVPSALTTSASLPAQDPSTALSTLSASFRPALPHLASRIQLPQPRAPASPDQTLEILMSHLHPDVCAGFYHPSSDTPYTSPLLATAPGAHDAHTLGTALSHSLGIADLFPSGTTTDSFLFSPCGFSSNSVHGDRYATIHVTPEVEYSYASFETNLDYSSGAPGGPSSLVELIERVLEVFRPAKLSITLFVSVDDDEGRDEGRDEPSASRRDSVVKELLNPALLGKYHRVDRIVYEFDGYSLVYAVWTAAP